MLSDPKVGDLIIALKDFDSRCAFPDNIFKGRIYIIERLSKFTNTVRLKGQSYHYDRSRFSKVSPSFSLSRIDKIIYDIDDINS